MGCLFSWAKSDIEQKEDDHKQRKDEQGIDIHSDKIRHSG